MKMPRFGYLAVTADFLHVGHVRFIKNCSDKCEKLVVGIMSDECVEKYKGARPVMNQYERNEIIKSLKLVHATVIQSTFEFPHFIHTTKHFWGDDFVIFDCDEHKRDGADFYIPRTANISSSQFRKELDESLNYSQLPL